MRYRMVWLVTLVLLFLWAGVSVVEARYLPFGTPDEKYFIEKVWAGREMEPMEGIWSIDGVTTHMQVAITRNTTETDKDYNFIGVIIKRSGNQPWILGEACLILKKGADSTQYVGKWLYPGALGAQRHDATLSMNSANNAFEISWIGWATKRLNGKRLYPVETSTPPKPTTS
jgi:hypothetical protein